jgi:hypothetical protein
MGLTSETIVFQRGRFRREPPVRSVLRVGRSAGIRHVITMGEGKSRESERGNYHG